jgi:hypothetical protein
MQNAGKERVRNGDDSVPAIPSDFLPAPDIHCGYREMIITNIMKWT